MKICAIICEFNPFHNGHKYLLERARELSGADFLLCLMSGSFTQRGEPCVADKFTRAKHAVLGGADVVLELPAPFATAPAEIFARGAVKLLSSIPAVSSIAFGCENADADELTRSAKILLEESDGFKKVLDGCLDGGQSYIKSYAEAFKSQGGNPDLLLPNNILAIEYVKSIIKTGAPLRFYPVQRVGAGYSDGKLCGKFSSATAIRGNLNSRKIKKSLPDFVYADASFKNCTLQYRTALKSALLRASADGLTKITGCNEGLENALKAKQNLPFEELLSQLTSKRYSSSRIMRILCANLLGFTQDDCNTFLQSPLYLTPLAVKKSEKNELFAELSKSQFPVITSGSDAQKLENPAKSCKNIDDFAFLQWQCLHDKQITEKLIIV